MITKEILEPEVGEVFEYKGQQYRAIEQIGCRGCAFDHDEGKEDCEKFLCGKENRDDFKEVIFLKVPKWNVGDTAYLIGDGIVCVTEVTEEGKIWCSVSYSNEEKAVLVTADRLLRMGYRNEYGKWIPLKIREDITK